MLFNWPIDSIDLGFFFAQKYLSIVYSDTKSIAANSPIIDTKNGIAYHRLRMQTGAYFTPFTVKFDLNCDLNGWGIFQQMNAVHSACEFRKSLQTLANSCELSRKRLPLFHFALQQNIHLHKKSKRIHFE